MTHNTNNSWRNGFHIQPPKGLLNDPNGLIYHKGVYHVFYQWHPDAPIHGLKYWNHVTSIDMVHWKKDKRVLYPDSIYDCHGAYSGSALVVNDSIELFYTGNTRTNSGRVPYQLQARLTEHEITDKRVIIDGIPEGYTDHFRDPKVFKTTNGYRMILGAQKTNLCGTALLYQSTDLNVWERVGELKTPFDGLGYMWECPDLFKLNNRDVFMFCPQGALNTPTSATNIYPNAYSIGTYIEGVNELVDATQPRLIDFGFEFYAAQTFTDSKKNRVMIAWLGSADLSTPSDIYGWAHVLSIPRILTIENDSLIQTPHPNLKTLRKECVPINTSLTMYELIIDGITNDLDIDLYHNNGESLHLSYNQNDLTLCLDRGNFSTIPSIERGTKRLIDLSEPLTHLHVFRDTSTVEIFVNNGKYTLSARFYPKDIFGTICISTNDINVTLYELEDVNNDI